MGEHGQSRVPRRIGVVIPAAGQSVRYSDKGYAIRKPFLTIRDKNGVIDTMLRHVIRRIPYDYTVRVGVPPGYVVNCTSHNVTPIEIEHTDSQVDTVLQLLDYTDDGVLVLDADSIVPVAGMLEYIEYTRPEMAVAVTERPDDEMGGVRPGFHFVERVMPGVMGIVGMRYFDNSTKLIRTIEKAGSLFSNVMNTYECERKQTFWVQWYEDWGTPEKLAAAGASIA